MFDELREELSMCEKMQAGLIGRVLNSYRNYYGTGQIVLKYMLQQDLDKDFWLINIEYVIVDVDLKLKITTNLVFQNLMNPRQNFMKMQYKYAWAPSLEDKIEYIESLDIRVVELQFGHDLTELIIDNAYESV